MSKTPNKTPPVVVKTVFTPAAVIDTILNELPEAKVFVEDVPVVKHEPITRLELARALPEYTGEPGRIVSDGIQSFKDTDFRTMNVVSHDGMLFKQTASH